MLESVYNKLLLGSSFFERDTVTVARELLGKHLVRKIGKQWIRVRIVETEAYIGENDPAAHCAKLTPRSKIMFEDPGVIYVYFIYGNYFMLNFVTEKRGKAGAVLIRAVQPVDGVEVMKELRGKSRKKTKQNNLRKLEMLTNGPAKLVLAMNIKGDLNGKPIGLPHLGVLDNSNLLPDQIVATTRIGISVGKELPFRFYEKNNSFVSVQK